jgi:cytosine/adenosine deaminase-related metal-dependent hydrolase
MPTLLARDAELLVTMDANRRELRSASLYAEDGIIRQVGPSAELPRTADTIIDCSGQILLPGFVNTHHHLNQTLTRALPAAQDASLFPWLQALYRVWARTDETASRASTLIGLAELALSGCTTVFDHTYIFKNGNTLDCQIDSARQLGIRFHASRGSVSLGQSKGGLPPDDCVEEEDDILRDSERLIKAYHDPNPGAMTQIALAPCSPFSVTPSLLRDSAALARQHKVRLHTHLCETLDEERYTLQNFGLRPVDWMETLGWLGDDVWFAHAIHVDDDEIRKLASTGCGAAHCPCSNMRLGSGIAPIKKYMQAGVKIGLGVDGSASNDASNMLLEARQAMLLARLRPSDDWMTAREVLELATLGGARVLGRSDIGSLEPGKCADFFCLDLHTPAYAGALHDPVSAILFCAPQPARTTVVHGKPIVRDGRIATMDMRPVIETHNRCAATLANAS